VIRLLPYFLANSEAVKNLQGTTLKAVIIACVRSRCSSPSTVIRSCMRERERERERERGMIYLPISLTRDNFARSLVYYSCLDAKLGHPKGEHETGRASADNEHIDLGLFHIGSARCRRCNTQLEKKNLQYQSQRRNLFQLFNRCK
jgi:hypothetical protein